MNVPPTRALLLLLLCLLSSVPLLNSFEKGYGSLEGSSVLAQAILHAEMRTQFLQASLRHESCMTMFQIQGWMMGRGEEWSPTVLQEILYK